MENPTVLQNRRKALNNRMSRRKVQAEGGREGQTVAGGSRQQSERMLAKVFKLAMQQ